MAIPHRRCLLILVVLFSIEWIAPAIRPLDRWDRTLENTFVAVFLRVVNVRGFWGYFLPLDLTMPTSMMFELFEWGAAGLLGEDEIRRLLIERQ
jgi:hypothetical protein